MFSDAPLKLDVTLHDQYFSLDSNQESTKDCFGVEIELEGINVITTSKSISEFWCQHIDGSLRNTKPNSQAIEYVFRKPLKLDDTEKAIARLFFYLNTNPSTVVFSSYRTSIHVHLDFGSETIRTIVNFITLAIIFDELFVSQNGETRIGNNFCLRTRDAEGQIANLIQSIIDYKTITGINGHNRYSSFNICSLTKFGTIEFRSLECTTDEKRLIRWIHILQRMKEASRDFTDPREIIAKFSRKGTLGFMISILGEYAIPYSKVPNYQNMLRDGMRLAQDLAFCSSWVHDASEPKKKRTKSYSPIDQYFQLGLQHNIGAVPDQPEFLAENPEEDEEDE